MGSFSAQSKALVVKNLRYQGRKCCQNCCLIFLPLFFMGLLSLLQSLVNDAIAKAGLTCGTATLINATVVGGCGATNCAGYDSDFFTRLLRNCTGDIDSNKARDGQSCVYPGQVQDVQAGDDWVAFTIGAALVTAEGKRANVMSPEMAEERMGVWSGTFSAVESSSRPDIGNSGPRNLPFCPIAHPEPFPPFLLVPQRQFRHCAAAGNGHCGTLLSTGGASPDFGAALASSLIQPANLTHAASVLSAGFGGGDDSGGGGGVDPAVLLALLGGGGGGGDDGGLDPATLLSSSGQSTFLPQMVDAMSGIPLGTTAIPSSQLFLDNAFYDAGRASDEGDKRRRLSHNSDETTLNSGGGMMAMTASCPALVEEARTAVAGAVAVALGLPVATAEVLAESLVTEDSLVPTIPLSCVNMSVDAAADHAAIDSAIFDGYFSDSIEAPNDDIREYAGAFDFRDSSTSAFEVDVLFNDTNQARRGGGPPVLVRVNAPMNMAAGAYLAERTRNLSEPYEAKLRSLRMMPQPARELRLDFSSLLGPLFYVWLIQLLLPVGLQVVVYEKEQRLRMMMKLMGLPDSVYWLVTYAYNLVMYVLFIIMLYVAGCAIGLSFFTLNSASLQFLFYFVYGNTQIAFTILVSTMFATSKTATVASYLWVFLSGLTANVLLPFFVQSTVVPTGLVLLLELIPAFSLYRGLYELSQYAFEGAFKASDGMMWENLSDEENGMSEAIWILIIEWPIFMALALYFDKVLDSGTGVRLPYCFCCRESAAAQKEHRIIQANSSKSGASPTLPAGDAVIEAAGLVKVYASRDGGPSKTAVDGVSMTVRRGECYGLLGQNGAGKTTTIMMLCGFTEPTDGDATVAGHSILTHMPEIYKCMGVCPQHNLLWETLTALEHVRFYATVKGVPAAQVRAVSMAALEAVSLAVVADKKAGEFSGGMKRRLSVAISLIGDPQVVFMDEPSTGLVSLRLLCRPRIEQQLICWVLDVAGPGLPEAALESSAAGQGERWMRNRTDNGATSCVLPMASHRAQR